MHHSVCRVGRCAPVDERAQRRGRAGAPMLCPGRLRCLGRLGRLWWLRIPVAMLDTAVGADGAYGRSAGAQVADVRDSVTVVVEVVVAQAVAVVVLAVE